MAIPDPYGRQQFHGKLGDNATIAMLKEAERKLGYELTITQFIGGASASAGTHTVGRMVDLAAWDWQNKLRTIFNLGGYGWYRPFIAGLWPAHIHVGSIFISRSNRKGIAASGWRQIAPWDNRRDGLKSNNNDFFKYRPEEKQAWTLADYQSTFRKPKILPTGIQLVRNDLVETIQTLGSAIAKTSEVRGNRVVFHKEAQRLIEERNHLKDILAKMPKK